MSTYTASYKVYPDSAQGTTDFTFTFPYIKEEHIEVYLDYSKIDQGTGSNQYQVITNVSPTLIRLGTGLASANLRVEIRRNSSLGTPLVDYADGSTLTAKDLDTSALQSLYIDQELKDAQLKTVSSDDNTGLPTLSSQRLTNVADPTAAQDAVTKAYLERTGSIASAQIANLTIVDGDIANTTITGGKLVNDTITATQIGANAITASELANNAVDTDAIADSNVTTAKIADLNVTTDKIEADAIDGTKIADDSIDSEHYADGSIDTAHIGDDQVTAAKLADTSVTGGSYTSTNLTVDAQGRLTAASSNTTPTYNTLNVTGTTTVVDVTTSGHITLPDNKEIKIGGSNDLRIWHGTAANDGNSGAINNYIDGGSHNLCLQIHDDSDSIVFHKRTGDGLFDFEVIASFIAGGACQLRYDNSQKIVTTDTGILVTGEVDSDNITGDAVVTSSTSTSDTKVYSAKRTSELIDAQIVALVDEVGGYVPIANELAFPNTNPDISDDVGTIVSIGALSTNYTSDGSGEISIPNGTVGNSTVTITGAADNTQYKAGYGLLVISTSTPHTYTFHRYTPEASDVYDVANSLTNVNTVATNITNVNTFANQYRIASSAPGSNNDTGDLYYNTSDNKLYIYNSSAWDVATSLSNSGGTVTGDITFTDNTKLKLGTGSDLQVYHSGSHSFIANTGGQLNLRCNTTIHLSDDDGYDQIKTTKNDSVELFYGQSSTPKLQTTSTGAKVTGKLGIGVDPASFFHLRTSTNHNLEFEESSGNLRISALNDARSANEVLQFAASEFNFLTGNATFAGNVKTNSVRNVDGDLDLYSSTNAKIRVNAGENAIVANLNGSVDLYYDGGGGASPKFKTTATGVLVTELTNSGNTTLNGSYVTFTGGSYNAVWDKAQNRLEFADNAAAMWGTDEDLLIYNNNSDSYIDHSGAGDLKIRSLGSAEKIQILAAGDVLIKTAVSPSASDDSIICHSNGSVHLYYDGGSTPKLHTRSDGVEITGVVSASDHIYLPDDKRLRLGNTPDLEIFHNSSDDTNRFYLSGKATTFWTGASNNHAGIKITDGEAPAVELYYDNSKKLETIGSGIIVYGKEGEAGRINLYADEGDNDADKWRIQALTDAAFSLQNYRSGSWETSLYSIGEGKTAIYFDDSAKLETYSGGVEIDGTLYIPNGSSSDNRISLGNNGNLKLWSSGSHSYLHHSNAGNLYIMPTTGDVVFDNGSGELARLRQTGNVDFTGIVNVTKSSAETAWGSKSLPSADSGLYVSNPNTTNGTYASLGVISKNSSSTDQSFSIVTESLAGGYRPNVYLTQRSGANAQTSAITIDSAGGVHINYDGSAKLTSTSSGVTVNGEVLVKYDKSDAYNAGNVIATSQTLLELRNENEGSTAFTQMHFRTGGGGDGFFGTAQGAAANDCKFYWANQTDGGSGKILAELDSATDAFTVSGTVSDSKGNVRRIIETVHSSAHTLVSADAGKYINISTGGVTIAANVFADGDAVTIINDSSSNQTITCSAVSMYLAGNTSLKTSLTLSGRGMATFICVGGNVFYGSGAGLS